MAVNIDKANAITELQCDNCGATEEIDADEFMQAVSYMRDPSTSWYVTKVDENYKHVCSVQCLKQVRAGAKK